MIRTLVLLARAMCLAVVPAALTMMSANGGVAGVIELFHADSLGGPMAGIKKAFEAKHSGATINLTPGTSRQLADRILNGDACDVFAPSSPTRIRRYFSRPSNCSLANVRARLSSDPCTRDDFEWNLYSTSPSRSKTRGGAS